MKVGAVYAYGNILALVLYLFSTLLLSLVQVKDVETEKPQEPMSATTQDPGPQPSIGPLVPPTKELPKACPNPSSKPIPGPSSSESLVLASLPPLPRLRSAELDNLVFTPQGPTHQDGLHDNHRLEWLGDATIQFSATLLLDELYPGLKCGAAYKIRCRMVSNEYLGELSRNYKLFLRYEEVCGQNISENLTTKIHADLFEAYVGALSKEQDFWVLHSYLSDLFKPAALAAEPQRSPAAVGSSPAPVQRTSGEKEEKQEKDKGKGKEKEEQAPKSGEKKKVPDTPMQQSTSDVGGGKRKIVAKVAASPSAQTSGKKEEKQEKGKGKGKEKNEEKIPKRKKKKKKVPDAPKQQNTSNVGGGKRKTVAEAAPSTSARLDSKAQLPGGPKPQIRNVSQRPSPVQGPTEGGPSHSSRDARIVHFQEGSPSDGRDQPGRVVESVSSSKSCIVPPPPPAVLPKNEDTCSPESDKLLMTLRPKTLPPILVTTILPYRVGFVPVPIASQPVHHHTFPFLSHGAVTTRSVKGTITQNESGHQYDSYPDIDV